MLDTDLSKWIFIDEQTTNENATYMGEKRWSSNNKQLNGHYHISGGIDETFVADSDWIMTILDILEYHNIVNVCLIESFKLHLLIGICFLRLLLVIFCLPMISSNRLCLFQ